MEGPSLIGNGEQISWSEFKALLCKFYIWLRDVAGLRVESDIKGIENHWLYWLRGKLYWPVGNRGYELWKGFTEWLEKNGEFVESRDRGRAERSGAFQVVNEGPGKIGDGKEVPFKRLIEFLDKHEDLKERFVGKLLARLNLEELKLETIQTNKDNKPVQKSTERTGHETPGEEKDGTDEDTKGEEY